VAAGMETKAASLMGGIKTPHISKWKVV